MFVATIAACYPSPVALMFRIHDPVALKRPKFQDNVEVARPASIGRRTRQSLELERQDEHQTVDVNNRITSNGQEERVEGNGSCTQNSDSKKEDFCAAGEKNNHENQVQPPMESVVKKISNETEEAPQRKRSRPPKKDYRYGHTVVQHRIKSR